MKIKKSSLLSLVYFFMFLNFSWAVKASSSRPMVEAQQKRRLKGLQHNTELLLGRLDQGLVLAKDKMKETKKMAEALKLKVKTFKESGEACLLKFVDHVDLAEMAINRYFKSREEGLIIEARGANGKLLSVFFCLACNLDESFNSAEEDEKFGKNLRKLLKMSALIEEKIKAKEIELDEKEKEVYDTINDDMEEWVEFQTNVFSN